MAYAMYASDAAGLRRSWVPLLLWGLGFILFGTVIIIWPEIVATSLLILLGASAVIGGLIWVSWALSLRRASEGVWMVTTVPGILLIAFGAFALVYREQVAQFFLWAVGAALAFWGLVDMISSWRLRAFFPGWWLRLLRGVLVAALGVVVLLNPISGLKALAWLIGAVPIAIGVVTVWMAFWVRRLPKTGPAVVVSGDVVEAELLHDQELPPAPSPPDDTTDEAADERSSDSDRSF